MTEDLQNTAQDTATAETGAEQGTVVGNTADTAPAETAQTAEMVSKKELEKATMRQNQLANELESVSATAEKIKELEEATGVSLEDLLYASKAGQETVDDDKPAELGEDFDYDAFKKLATAAVSEELGPKLQNLEKMSQFYAKLEAKEMVGRLPQDYKSFEPEMVKFMEKNPDIAKMDNAAEIAYNYVKGSKSAELTETAVTQANKEKATQEAEKGIAFVEEAKSQTEDTRVTSVQDYINLDRGEWAKIPTEVRQEILKNLGK